MESTKDLQQMKPPLALGEEILGRPQGRKMRVQEGQASSKVTLH